MSLFWRTDAHVQLVRPSNWQMTTTSYWTDRFSNLGHTGWSNPVIYCYDQPERLALLETAILKWSSQRGRALDFGCGTGDFSRMLLRLGYEVCGYDPYVRPRLTENTFTYASSYEAISLKEHDTNLVLSITTLDHILEQAAFIRAVKLIRRLLHESGVFILLEYALDSVADREKFGLSNNYQSFRTLAEWEECLSEAGFQIVQVIPAPHPILNPFAGYLSYSQSSIVRLRRLCERLPLVRSWFTPLLKHAAEEIIRGIPPQTEFATPSPLKLICCRPE